MNHNWVKPYINSLFSSSSEQHEQEELLLEKMKYINKPFYKYCYVCEENKRGADKIDYNIENFKNNCLFFQNPANFNDPFDCYMGFSQVELVRNLLITSMKQQHKYSPSMRKAIESFFSDEVFNPISYNSISSEDWLVAIKQIIPILLNQFGEDELLRNYTDSFLTTLLNGDYMELFLKLVQNKLTIMDKQQIVDLIYQDEAFKTYAKSKITNKDMAETIIDIVRHDTKLKIETTPDSVLSDTENETFQIFDLFQLIIDSFKGNKDFPEFSDIKKQLKTAGDDAVSKSRMIISEQCRITCLSERMDSPLMWSHYANKHYGFCLEYDFTHSMIKNFPDLWLAKLMLFPVIYSESRPLLSNAIANPSMLLQYKKTHKMPNYLISNIIFCLLFKSKEWEYEQEWRIILINNDKPTLKLPPPRKVFLGANMEDSARNRVVEIAKSKRIPIYQMFLTADKYQFSYYKVE